MTLAYSMCAPLFMRGRLIVLIFLFAMILNTSLFTKKNTHVHYRILLVMHSKFTKNIEYGKTFFDFFDDSSENSVNTM